MKIPIINLSHSYLKITFIDVGSGDSIFIETKDDKNNIYFGLIDSNDTLENASSKIYLKRYFERNNINLNNKPLFKFIILSHDHADHAQGLKNIMRIFGTEKFWYPKTENPVSLTNLLKYCNRVGINHESIDNRKIIPSIGNLRMKILWPKNDSINLNENNNSILLKLTFFDKSIFLTGNLEADMWKPIIASYGNIFDDNALLFKVPHHGAYNGTFDMESSKPWHDICPKTTDKVISCHIKPYNHPDNRVIDLLNSDEREVYRTDKHSNITFITYGNENEIIFSH